MKWIFVPATALMRRLKYPEKFALIGALLVLPLVVALVLLLREVHHSRAIAERELAGTQYVQAVRSLLEELQQHRSLSAAVFSGTTALRDSRTDVERHIDEHLARIDDLDDTLGAILDTTGRWSALKSEWSDLRERDARLPVRESFEAHTILISHVLDLIRHVGNTSTLLLDPELRSHHLMDAVINGIPALGEYLAQVRGWGSAATSRTSGAAHDRYLLTDLNSLIGAELVTVRRRFTAAFGHDAALRPILEPLLHDAIAKARRYVRFMIEQIMIEDGQLIAADALWQEGAHSLDSSYALYDAASTTLTGIISSRIARLQARENLVAVLSLLALAAVVYLFVGFYQGVMETVTRLDKAAERMAAGKLEDPVLLPASQRDELVIVTRAFAKIATRLRQEWHVAQEKRAEAMAAAARVAESEAHTAAIMEAAADGIITIDESGTIQSFNSAAKLMFGYSAAEVVGKNVSALMPEPHQAQHGEYLARYLQTGVPSLIGQRRELEGLRQDGTLFPMRLAVSEMLWNGQRSFTGIITDISLQRRTEEELRQAQGAALEANRLTAAFLANVSHAFRTPLSGIFGMADLATETVEAAELQEFVQTIRTEVESLLSVLSDIMDFAKLEAGELVSETVPFSLRQGLRDTLQPLAVRAQQKDIDLVCDVAADLPDTVQGDLSHLLQSVGKVAENAIKFTEAGEVVVRASVVSATADDVVVDIAVADTGPGIPPDRQVEIFRPFAHATEPRTTQTGGTGLGLAITSKLMTAMDGEMRLESVAGSGSTFHMTVPLRLDREGTPDPAAGSALQGHAALVVDDNPAAREALLATLRTWGATATAVGDAEAATRTLRAAHDGGRPFALVVVDAGLRGVDGFTLTARLQADPDTACTAVVLLTASGSAADLQRSRTVGAAACVTKPFVPTRELRSVLEEVVTTARDPERRAAGGQPAARAPLKVLLVEDNDVGRMVTTRLIEKAGHHVVSAVNGVEAVAVADEQRFDLILMDIQMPEMDGFQATAAIRDRERATGDHVPIIALTAYTMSGERERSLDAGMDAYVSKPVRSGELFATIERLQREVVREEAPLVCAWEAPQVLDPATLRAQTGSDPNALFDTAWRLLSESRTLLESIRSGIDSGDRSTVEQGARQLKGSLRTLTASSARTAALRLEAVARAGDLSQVSDLMSRLEHEVDRLEPAISLLDVNHADA